jgi:hypothetical protein
MRCVRPRRRRRPACLMVTWRTRRLVTCSGRRWTGSHPMPRRPLPRNHGGRLRCSRSDSNSGCRRRRSRVADQLGGSSPVSCRDGRPWAWVGRGRRCQVGRRGRRRRRNVHRCRGRRRRRRFRCGRRLGRGGRMGAATRRKKLERIDVRLAASDPDAEVHVRHGVLWVPGRTGLRDHVPFRDRLAAMDMQLPEMRQRRLVLARRDRDREAVGGNRPGERHGARNRRAERERSAEPDVDSTVLAGCVCVAAHGEAAQDRPVRRPGPRPRGRAHRKGGEHDGGGGYELSRCPGSEHASTVAAAEAGDNAKLTSCYRERR